MYNKLFNLNFTKKSLWIDTQNYTVKLRIIYGHIYQGENDLGNVLRKY